MSSLKIKFKKTFLLILKLSVQFFFLRFCLCRRHHPDEAQSRTTLTVPMSFSLPLCSQLHTFSFHVSPADPVIYTCWQNDFSCGMFGQLQDIFFVQCLNPHPEICCGMVHSCAVRKFEHLHISSVVRAKNSG